MRGLKRNFIGKSYSTKQDSPISALAQPSSFALDKMVHLISMCPYVESEQYYILSSSFNALSEHHAGRTLDVCNSIIIASVFLWREMEGKTGG